MALVMSELEGPITSIAREGTGAKLVVLGITVIIDEAAANAGKVRTPTGTLSIERLTDVATPLLGLAEGGFIGCTAALSGNYDDDDPAGVLKIELDPTPPPGLPADAPFELHPSIDVGPPESLISGPVTARSAPPAPAGGLYLDRDKGFTVDNVPIEILALKDGPGVDPRLVGEHPENEFGFHIKLETVPLGALASVEGYFSRARNAFIGFKVTVDGAAELTDDALQVSVTRARARNRDTEFDIDLRGGLITRGVDAGEVLRVDVYRDDKTTAPNLVPNSRDHLGQGLISDLRPAAFSKWRFNARIPKRPAPRDKAPRNIVVVYTVGARPSVRSPDEDNEVTILKE